MSSNSGPRMQPPIPRKLSSPGWVGALSTPEWLSTFARQSYFRIVVIVLALFFVWILFAGITNGIFLSPRNLSNLIRQMTIISFLAMGMSFVVISGKIDISVGSVAGLTSMIAACCQVLWLPPLLTRIFPGAASGTLSILSTILTIIITMGSSMLIGLIQGTIIAYGMVPAFVVTLGGQFVWRGVILAISKSRTVTPIEDSLRLIAQGYLPGFLGWVLGIISTLFLLLGIFVRRSQHRSLGFKNNKLYFDLLKVLVPISGIVFFIVVMNVYRGIANPVLLMLVVGVVLSYILNNTTFGRYVYAIGGGLEAASLAGINIKKVELKVFLLIGLMCGISGIVLTGYVAAGTVAGGFMFELMAIASCFIGGVSIGGGEGTLVGALIGCLFMTSLDNGMSVMNLAVYWQYVVKGSVLAIAVYWDIHSRRRLQK